MPFKQVDPIKELEELNNLLDSDQELKCKFYTDQKEFEFRIKLAQARKKKNLTQSNIKDITGLTQQAISRIEKSNDRSPTLRTLIRYCEAIGYELSLTDALKQN